MKAQSFFGGTNPKDSATKSKVKGNSGMCSGGGIDMQRKTTVKQVGNSSANQANTSKQVRDKNFSTKHIDSIARYPGKEDNRTTWR